MNGWQLARYLIDAKKCIDSLLYINNNFKKLNNLDLREIIESKLRHFYINLCIIIDNSYKKKDLLEMKKDDENIKKIYYERDKNYAHKDENYQKKDFLKLNNLIKKLKKELDYCLIKCKDNLPKDISTDYVSHDKNLFRFVNQISPQLEQKINELMYEKGNITNGKTFKVFDDTEDIKEIENSNNYAVIINNGLTLKEGLQNRQDFCIKVNVLYKTNMWCTISRNDERLFETNEKKFINFLDTIKREEKL